MSLLFPAFLALPLLLILALPLLIHLIQLFRQRRVRWGAMDFLLASQRKLRKWILLRQFLLLALRVGALLLLLAMLAQPIIQGTWAQLLGQAKTHHVVLLDDSYSMADQAADRSAFDLATRFVAQLVENTSSDPGSHRISLLRFSAARQLESEPAFDLFQQSAGKSLSLEVEQLLGAMRVSQSDAGPGFALEAIEKFAEQPQEARQVLYLVSDFREPQWQDAEPLKQQLERLSAAGIEIHLVRCAEQHHPNLAIVSLQPSAGALASGVETVCEVAVKNFGEQAARGITVRLEEDGHPRPSLVLDEIPAGETISQRFAVRFPEAGPHTLSASIPDDALDIDNERFLAVQLSDEIPVLVVDGGPSQRDAYFISTALAPGDNVRTGIRPRVESIAFLRNHQALAEFSSIFLANFGRLDDADVAALERYVRDGGGLALFLGEQTSPQFVNQTLFRGGDGLLPIPVSVPTDLLDDRSRQVPDLEVFEHPMFAILAGQQNSFLESVSVMRYFAPARGWSPEPDRAIRVLARLRNGDPFAVEKPFGEGRVVAVLSKASPEDTGQGSWNNWGRNNPSFVVALLELERYLSRSAALYAERLIGQPITLTLDPARYAATVQFEPPAGSASGPVSIPARVTGERASFQFSGTDVRGFYRGRLATLDGREEIHLFDCNVPPAEGQLKLLDRQGLASQLEGLDCRIHTARELEDQSTDKAGFNLSSSIWYLLLGLLGLEQLIAYAASYHPTREFKTK